jgi:uracil-DNA glycosylase family 4
MSNSARDQILAEIGIKPIWRLRSQETEQGEAQSVQSTSLVPELHVEEAQEALPARLDKADAVSEVPSQITVQPAAEQAIKELDWDGLQRAVSDCRACRLCERRKQAVLGVGDRQADWLFVGEGPGAEEDERGEPFVGQSGKLLDVMLSTVGLQRGNNVYIANAVKCRPPGNRTPEAGEMATCRPFLERQIALIKPRLIVAMGRPAVQSLLGGEPKISASRRRVFRFADIPVVVTYHPAYLLRNLPDKAKAWEDLCFAQDEMAKVSWLNE